MESIVELLVLWCYGFTKSWIRLASLSQPDVKGECPAKLPGRLPASPLAVGYYELWRSEWLKDIRENTVSKMQHVLVRVEYAT